MKKILFTTVCNDRYLPGLLVFLFSFKKHHPTWNYPFKVYHRDDLSERSIKQLKIVYPNLIFELITDPKFYDKEAHYMCLLPFKEYDYDQVIFLDCDMLCLGPIDDILNVKTGLAACLEYKFKFPKKHIIHSLPYLFRPLIHFNTGVFSVKKPLLNEKTYNKLVSLIDKNILKRKKLWDQDIINEAFRFEKKSILPFTFNPKKNVFKSYFNHKKDGIKIIHFTGPQKPWYVSGCDFLYPLEDKYVRYQPLHNLWHQERQSFKDQYGFDPMQDFINLYQ